MLKCPDCNSKVSIKKSKTKNNPNRDFYACPKRCWIGWVDEGSPRIFKPENDVFLTFI